MKPKETIWLEHMTEASENSLVTFNLAADNRAFGKPSVAGVDEWTVKAYVMPTGQLVMSAYWRDALGDLHERPVIQQGAPNVARYDVPLMSDL
jgi:hypothetical protein